LVGAVAGTILIPVPLIGTIIGSCVGAGAGAWALEAAGRKTPSVGARIVVGAGLGRFFGVVSKLAVGGLIWMIITVAAYWP
jgi:uncharacterized protein